MIVVKKDLQKAETRKKIAARFLQYADELTVSAAEELQIDIYPVTAKAYYKTAEIATAFQVSDRMVRKWCEQGKIQAIQTPGGAWRIPAAQFGDLSKVRAFQETTEQINSRFSNSPGIDEFER
ncbi:helix-turn-helix domain-containing protein [Hydrogenispora ethanolica]|jgi:excisionase family DNA binding protein|nr:helix-turn-helix domain-containing protein [Hydrogenispora ethanolica]